MVLSPRNSILQQEDVAVDNRQDEIVIETMQLYQQSAQLQQFGLQISVIKFMVNGCADLKKNVIKMHNILVDEHLDLKQFLDDVCEKEKIIVQCSSPDTRPLQEEVGQLPMKTEIIVKKKTLQQEIREIDTALENGVSEHEIAQQMEDKQTSVTALQAEHDYEEMSPNSGSVIVNPDPDASFYNNYFKRTVAPNTSIYSQVSSSNPNSNR